MNKKSLIAYGYCRTLSKNTQIELIIAMIRDYIQDSDTWLSECFDWKIAEYKNNDKIAINRSDYKIYHQGVNSTDEGLFGDATYKWKIKVCQANDEEMEFGIVSGIFQNFQK